VKRRNIADPRGHGGVDAFDDIRDQLRRDHESALSQLDALRAEEDDSRCRARLQKLRRSWVIHALAEETVVYRALEGADAAGSSTRADERFVEHDLVDGLFDKLTRSRPRSLEWNARLNVVRELIARHIQTEHDETFSRLATRFDSEALLEMGRRFELASSKLTMLEEAKAA
jgi:DNA-binding helix-hairpin-helix protein with protein kinase domain